MGSASVSRSGYILAGLPGSVDRVRITVLRPGWHRDAYGPERLVAVTAELEVCSDRNGDG